MATAGATDERALPGPATKDGLAAYNAETMKKYGLPEVTREDAHVYKDEDGYYVVKEEYQKPTNPFERFKLGKVGDVRDDPFAMLDVMCYGIRAHTLRTTLVAR